MLEHGGRLLRAARRYGIPARQWLDLSTGVSPFPWPVPPLPPAAWHRLPEDEDGLIEAACAYYGAPSLIAVAGSQAAIQALPALRPRGRVGVLEPGYAEHAHAWETAGHAVQRCPAARLLSDDGDFDVVVLIHPNNPGGEVFEPRALLELHARLAARGGWLVVDEAFMDATPERSLVAHTEREGLIVLRSVGKFFGMAGARAGFVAAPRELLQGLRERLGPWTVAGPTRAALKLAFADREWQAAARDRLHATSARLAAVLAARGLEPTASTAFFHGWRDARARDWHEALARRGILTRLFEQPPSLRFGLPGDDEGHARLDQALAAIGREGFDARPTRGAMPEPAPPAAAPVYAERARVLMVQGCTSDAGKSTVVTALCRWARRRGLRVAPFKPQNMALNSAVTVDGGEIGRAQAVQAQACGLPPHTDFNPVLLKPNTDVGAQVIVHGRAVGNMDARDYHRYKQVAMEAVLASHARLVARFDAVLVEGAGSPAEINLRDRDIANMGYAEAVDCPVLLVADIDRGGVFAHLVGTLALLSASERERIVGFVINRFRGDIALLQPGLDWLERETGKPVLGVLPYLHGLHLEAEDALPAARSRPGAAGNADGGRAEAGRDGGDAFPVLRVVVPVFPRISNHTDLDPLRAHPQVQLQFVGPGQAPPPCDLIVLPGSKSTRADLAWLQAEGWPAAIDRHLRYGGRVIGICGGLQMLGRAVHDPEGIEGAPGSSAGLGLLDLDTTLAPHKQLRRVGGRLRVATARAEPVPHDAPGNAARVEGYEIHCGVSDGPALRHPAVQFDDGRLDGACSADGRLFGTYVHGLFDHPDALATLLRWAGLREPAPLDMPALREQAIDRLADAVEAHLDTARLARLLEAPTPCAA